MFFRRKPPEAPAAGTPVNGSPGSALGLGPQSGAVPDHGGVSGTSRPPFVVTPTAGSGVATAIQGPSGLAPPTARSSAATAAPVRPQPKKLILTKPVLNRVQKGAQAGTSAVAPTPDAPKRRPDLRISEAELKRQSPQPIVRIVKPIPNLLASRNGRD